jgi:hypothetical protein
VLHRARDTKARYPRLAVHTPLHVPSEPVPRQEPRPEFPLSRPPPLAREDPELTLTDVAPLGATRPPTANPPPPPYTPPLRTWRRNIPPELQLPRVVVMVTHQDPSNGFAASAASIAAVKDRANRAVPTAKRKLGFTAPSPAESVRANPRRSGLFYALRLGLWSRSGILIAAVILP